MKYVKVQFQKNKKGRNRKCNNDETHSLDKLLLQIS